MGSDLLQISYFVQTGIEVVSFSITAIVIANAPQYAGGPGPFRFDRLGKIVVTLRQLALL